MSEDLRVTVEPRESVGSSSAKRLRASGRIPASLYGFGKSVESVSLPADVVEQIVATRSSVVDVDLGGNVDKAVVQELQWDVFSTHVQHVDFRRVDPAGVATVKVPVELRGEPAGVKDGGILRQKQKTLSITCPDYRIPKGIVVRVGALQMGDAILAGAVALPEYCQLESDADAVVVELHDPRKSA